MELKLSEELYTKSGVYCIKNLIDDRLYIGSAIKLKKRYNSHNQNLNKGKHHSSYLQNFVKKYGINKLSFQLVELCEPEQLITMEQKWIDFYNSKSVLFNICKTAGNTLGYKHTPETIELLKNKKISDETRDKQSAWQKGKSKPEELKNKWKDGRRKGKSKSEDFKKFMSKKMKGNKNAEGTIQNKEMTKKRGEKVGTKLKGRTLSDTQKKKISNSSPFKGITRSEEYKRNMSESCKKRFKKD